MEKGKIKRWLGRGVFLLFVLWLLYLFAYKYIYQNLPSNVSLELQKIITETAGRGFEVWLPGPEETNIDGIYIDVDSDLFEDERIFETCNRIKDVVYDYVKTHPENFELYPFIDREKQSVLGLTISFADFGGHHLCCGTNVVFQFSNYLENKDRYDEGFCSMRASSLGIGGYGYQLSDLKAIKGVKELFLSEINIDDPEVLGEMENLEYLKWEEEPGFVRERESQMLEEAADKYGIKFETYVH